MKATVRVTMPIDAVNEPDAREAVRVTIARWLHGRRNDRRLHEIEEWLDRCATIEVLPDDAQT